MDFPKRQVAGVGLLIAVAAAATLLVSPGRVVTALTDLAVRPLLFGAALVILYAVRPLFAWPISPINAVVGYVLGLQWGVPVALVGAVLTCIPPFLVARHVGRGGGGVFGRLNRAGQRVIEVTGAVRGVLAARLSPLPADPVSYGAGFSGVSTRAYLLGTFLGEIPWVVVEVLAGASMHRITMEGLGAGLHVLAASFAVAVLMLAGPAYRHVQRPASQ